jgi:hypothetical protein
MTACNGGSGFRCQGIDAVPAMGIFDGDLFCDDVCPGVEISAPAVQGFRIEACASSLARRSLCIKAYAAR